MTTVPPFGTVIAGHELSDNIMRNLHEAAKETGVGFDFLVAQASVESGFQGQARAGQSSAAGLFQFTAPTWLQMMYDHGAKYGYADLAKAVRFTRQGGITVDDKETERRILALRENDRLSALFAAEYAKSNAHLLAEATGHKATALELHLAHLLGPTGAIRFLKAHDANEKQTAAKVLPEAARFNPNLFYGRGRTAQSVAAVYRKIQERFDVPLRQMAQLESGELRPALGLSDSLPHIDERA